MTTQAVLAPLTGTLLALFVSALAGLVIMVRGDLARLRAHVWFQRWLTWAGMAALCLGALWLGGVAAVALAALIAWQAAREAAALLDLDPRARRVLLTAAPVTVTATALRVAALPWLPLLFAAMALLTMAIGGLRLSRRAEARSLWGSGSRDASPALSLTSESLSLARALAAYVWVVWPVAHVVALGQHDGGIAWLVVVCVMVGLADVAACVVGSRLGGPKLAPVVSPGKTWSGLAGGVAGAYLAFALLAPLRPALPLAVAMALPALVAVLGALGDLFESWLKRRAGVKDAGNWLPGFGGLLDRIDSALFVLPVVGWLVQWI